MPNHIYCDFEFRPPAAHELPLAVSPLAPPRRYPSRVQLVLGCFFHAQSGRWTDIDFRSQYLPDAAKSMYGPLPGLTPFAQLARYVADMGPDAIWFGFSAHAEITAMLAAGIDVSAMRWIDLMAEARPITVSHPRYKLLPRETNLLRTLAKFGIPTRGDAAHKQAMVQHILATAPDRWEAAAWASCIDYCRSDVEPLVTLWRAIRAVHAEVGTPYSGLQALFNGEYVRALALLDDRSRGLPVNTALLNRLYANRPLVMRALAEQINAHYGATIYRYDTVKRSYVFYHAGLREHLLSQPERVPWEQTAKGATLRTDEKWLDEFCKKYPQYQPLGRTMHTIRHFSSTDLRQKVRDGFIHAVSLPYHTTTGRNQPLVSEGFILNMQPFLRALMCAAEDHVVIAADWSQQEIVVASCLSGDRNLQALLATGDVYLALGKQAGAIPEDGTKRSHPVQRQTYKTCLAAGTLVVTPRGPVPIEQVTTEDLLWDGIEWVSHDGLVYQGQRATLSLSGISLTPEHLVWCGTQMRAAQSVATDASGRFLRSALSAASLPSPATSPVSVAGSWPSWSGVPAASRNTRLTVITSGTSAAHTARPVGQNTRPVADGGSIRAPCPRMPIGSACSTGLVRRSPAATLQAADSLSLMVSGESASTPSGTMISRRSSPTSGPCRDGIIPIWKWTEQTMMVTTSPATSGSLRGATTTPIDASSPRLSAASGTSKPVYDLVNAGPRRRFTILTPEGVPITVSNCQLALGYGQRAQSLGYNIYQDLLTQSSLSNGRIPPPVLDQCIYNAHSILQWHRRYFTDFWRWNQSVVECGKRNGYMTAMDGWTTFCNRNSSSNRLGNFPVQANSALILRQAIKLLAKHPEIEYVTSLHDAIYIHCPIADQVEHTNTLIRVMTEAARSVLRHTVAPMDINIDVSVYDHLTGYSDERDVTTLPAILKLLDAQGV